MYALELTVEIDENRQIHLQLPDTICAQTTKVIVLYEETAQTSGWPEGYFDTFVPIEGAVIERAPQGELEERLPLEFPDSPTTPPSSAK